MKLFITVFSAIIAAAAVIGAILWGINRVNNWERAKLYHYNSFEVEYKATAANINRESEAHVREMLRELLAIYENKPFGLPLSEQDRKLRDFIKQEFDKETRMRVEADLEAISNKLGLYKFYTGAFPTAEQGLQALVEPPTATPLPPGYQPFSRELSKDPWGHDYIYKSSDGTTYDLLSAGSDGVPNTADDIRKP
jgi:general secretion pathway protein G